QTPGPATLKTGWPIVGGVNTWGLHLVNIAWQPASGVPWVYEERFNGRAAVRQVLGRCPNTALQHGTLRAFAVGLLGADPARTLTESSPNLEITEHGFLRGYDYRLDPPVVADGLRLTVREAERVPVLYDLLAFGQPVTQQ